MAVSPDFLAFFYFMNGTHLATKKQAKIVLLKESFSRRFSNFNFEKFDSAQCQPTRSRNCFVSYPFKNLTKNVGFDLCSTPMDLFFSHFPSKGKERPAKTKLMPAKLSAVLATFGFSEI